MEDKIFDLISKIYTEMQDGFKGINTKLIEIEKRLDRVELRLDKVEQRLDTVELRLDKVEQNQTNFEKYVISKLEPLYDICVQNTENINELNAKVDCLWEKIGNVEMEVKVFNRLRNQKINNAGVFNKGGI
jgi:predicted  nucleic acid-binding Zn-ribbon protein